MRLEPHENLTLWAFGHLHNAHRWFGHDMPDRCHHPRPTRVENIHHHHHHTHPVTVVRPRVEVRVVDHPQRPEPIDLRACLCGGHQGLENESPIIRGYTPTAWPYVETARPTDTQAVPAPFPMAQDFVFGQAVPATGGLLDIMA